MLSTAHQIATDHALTRARLPCPLDREVLSIKRSRGRQPRRSCRPCRFTMNCWLEHDSDFRELMMQIQFVQDDQDAYHVTSVKYCARYVGSYLVGGTLARTCSIQMLDEKWVYLREAVDPLLCSVMQFLATSTPTAFFF